MSAHAGHGPPLAKTSKKRPLARDSTTDLNSSGHRPRHANKKLCVEPVLRSSSPISVLRDRDVNSTTRWDIRGEDATEMEKKSDSQESFFDAHATKRKTPSFAAVVAQHVEKNSVATVDPDVAEIEKLKKPDNIAALLSRRGWWTADILELFGPTSIAELSLSKTLTTSSFTAPTTVLGAFLRPPMGFECLQTLSLSKVSLSLKDIACLRMLPCIKALDLAATRLTTQHLLHLAIHADTLERLNIAMNPTIDDDARVPLSALGQLRTISLRDTSITLPCLRLLVYALPQGCRFMTLPSATLEYLNSRTRRYCVQIPQDYCSDPRQIPELNVAALKRNLELHKRSNSDITITGSKVEMVTRLSGILCDRVADEKIASRVGRLK